MSEERLPRDGEWGADPVYERAGCAALLIVTPLIWLFVWVWLR